MVPSTARRLADELNKLKAVLRGGVRMPPWLMPLLEPNRSASSGSSMPTRSRSARRCARRGRADVPPPRSPAHPRRDGRILRAPAGRTLRAASRDRLLAVVRRRLQPRWAPPCRRRATLAHSQDARLGRIAPPQAAPSAARPQSARPAYGERPLSARPQALPRPSSAWPPATAPSGAGRAQTARAGMRGGALGSARGRITRPSTAGPKRPPWVGIASATSSPQRATSASPRSRRSSLATPAVGVGGGIVGHFGPPRAPLGVLADATQRPNPQPRGKSPRNRKRAGAFARPPVGALSLSATPAAERPNGLLGSVLRREAAIAAMKTAVQTEPPPEATHMRERKKLIRELADTMHEFREATVDAIELLAQRPEGSSRFYWNGMDLVLKMLTDMQWGPFPQTLDPLLWRWFNHWSAMWARRREATNPEPFDVRGGAPFLQRCRLAEKALLHMAGREQ